MESVNEIVRKVKESEVNSNGIIDLFELIKEDNPQSLVTAAIHGLVDIFKHYIVNHLEWFTNNNPHTSSTANKSLPLSDMSMASNLYPLWLRSKYQLSLTTFLDYISISTYQVTVVIELMDLLQCFGSVETIPMPKEYNFPNDLFLRIISSILTAGNQELTSYFISNYIQYTDIKYFTLKNISSIIGTQLDTAYRSRGSVSMEFGGSVYQLLKEIIIKKVKNKKNKDTNEEDDGIQYFVMDPKDFKNQQAIDVKTLEKHSKVFSKAWLLFLQLPLPPHVHKSVLLSLHSQVMPHMNKPHLLVDYLVGCYDQGGVYSILALNGLFILMHHYHIEYPHFYQKLYSLLRPDIFTVPYTPRFFRLLNVFLSSSHLPLYLVASFAKKIARLSLTAPPEGIMMASVLVINLIRRHPNCRVLLHRSTTEVFEIDSDPFLMEESDPSLSHALESCLWELKTLQCHYHPAVSSIMSRLLDPEKQDKEETLYQHLQLTSKQLFINELSSSDADDDDDETSVIPLNYTTPTTFWGTFA